MPHRPRLGLLLVTFLLTMSNGLVSVLAESPNGLIVIITYPDQDYPFGSTATVSIHVLLGGQSVDPDRIEADVGISSHKVSVERDETGL